MARLVETQLHLAWPFRLTAAGRFAAVEEDTLDDVAQCVRILQRTPLGARPLAPLVGLPDPTFTTGVDPVDVARRLETDEPRALVTVTADPVTSGGRQAVRIRVDLADDAQDIDPEAAT